MQINNTYDLRHPSPFLFLYLSVCLPNYTNLPTSLPTYYPPISYLSTYLPADLPIYYLSVYLSNDLSLSLSLHLCPRLGFSHVLRTTRQQNPTPDPSS